MARRQESDWEMWNDVFNVALDDAGYSALTDMAIFDHVSSTDDVVLQVEDALRTMWESGMSPEEAIMEIEDTFFSEKYNIDLDGADEEYSGEDADDLDQQRDDGDPANFNDEETAQWQAYLARHSGVKREGASRELGEAVSAKDLVKTSDREYKIGQYVLDGKYQSKFDVFVRPDPDEYGVKLTVKPLSLKDAVEFVKADARRKPARLVGSHTAAPKPKRFRSPKKSLRLDDFLD